MSNAALMSFMLGLLVLIPAGCAFVLRQARAPGWGVLGGVLAGLLLGPTIFGRIAPAAHEAVFVGGVEHREELERLISRQGADMAAAEAAGFDRSGLVALRETHRMERAEREAHLRDARWSHQKPLRMFTAVVIAISLLGAGRAAVPTPPRGHRQHMISAISIGLWSAAIPGAAAYVAAVQWWGWSAAEAAITASAVMIGPWALTAIDRYAADRAEHGGAHLIQTAGRIASLLAIALTGWVAFTIMGLSGLAWCVALASFMVSWVVRAPRWRLSSPASDDGRRPAGEAGVFACVVIPALAALAAVRIEFFAHFALWPILLLLALSGDGRWLGALVGAMMLGGRRGLRTMRLVLGSMACGPTQLAIVALTANLWLIPGQAIMALTFGAVLIEATAPLRRSMAKRLTEAEEWELE